MAWQGTVVPNDQRDEDTGRFTEKYTDSEFLEALRELDGAAGTQEIADELICNYNTAYSKLRQLEDEGKVTRRKVGNANLWMIANDG